MGQVLIRELPDEVVARLKARAAAEGRSLEAHLRIVLDEASRLDRAAFIAIADAIAERTRGRDFGAERLGQLADETELLLFANAAAGGDDPLGLREVDRLPRLAERRLWRLTDVGAVQGRGHRAQPRRSGAFAYRVASIGAHLDGGQVRQRAFEHDLGGELALEDRPREPQRDGQLRLAPEPPTQASLLGSLVNRSLSSTNAYGGRL